MDTSPGRRVVLVPERVRVYPEPHGWRLPTLEDVLGFFLGLIVISPLIVMACRHWNACQNRSRARMNAAIEQVKARTPWLYEDDLTRQLRKMQEGPSGTGPGR